MINSILVFFLVKSQQFLSFFLKNLGGNPTFNRLLVYVSVIITQLCCGIFAAVMMATKKFLHAHLLKVVLLACCKVNLPVFVV